MLRIVNHKALSAKSERKYKSYIHHYTQTDKNEIDEFENRIDPDEAVPFGVVGCGSALFALYLSKYFKFYGIYSRI